MLVSNSFLSKEIQRFGYRLIESNRSIERKKRGTDTLRAHTHSYPVSISIFNFHEPLSSEALRLWGLLYYY